jgi:hypothetical protein
VSLDNHVVIQAKQLNFGKSALQLYVGKDEANGAKIPDCLLKKKGKTFERSVLAMDKTGKPVALVDKVKNRATTVRSKEVRRSDLQLFFPGKGSKNTELEVALQRLSIKFTDAPVK